MKKTTNVNGDMNQIGDNNSITVQNVVVQMTAPSDAIGADACMRGYISYLVKRYNQWRRKGIGEAIDEAPFHHAKIYAEIDYKFGTKWDFVPKNRFEDLCDWLYTKIDETEIGKRQRRDGNHNFHTFKDHCDQILLGKTPSRFKSRPQNFLDS